MMISELLRLLKDAENEFGEIEVRVEGDCSLNAVKSIYFIENEDGKMDRHIVIEQEQGAMVPSFGAGLED